MADANVMDFTSKFHCHRREITKNNSNLSIGRGFNLFY